MRRINPEEEIGKRYGNLTILEFLNPEEHGVLKLKAKCLCDCGKEKITYLHHLRSGDTRSCGHLLGDNNRKHDLCREHRKLVYIWEQMIRRCEDPKSKRYKDYGGRGITVCPEWKDIKIFAKWMLSKGYIEGGDLSLDRINNDKGYSPENCRLANKFVQARNRRKQKSNTSGYVGVNKLRNKWVSIITIYNKRYVLGYFSTKKEALEARNKYIIENNISEEYKIQKWEDCK